MSGRIVAEDWGWRHASRRAWAVRHLNFVIEPGERVLLLGASGAGKSTLLAGLAGVLGDGDEGEESGSLLIDGLVPRDLRGHAALVMQDPESQIVLARIGDEVAFGCENMCVPVEEIWPRVEQGLSSVGLALPLGHPSDHLSGGQQQRLVLAGALAMGADLLLLDEPTANLDPAGVHQVRTSIGQLLQERSNCHTTAQSGPCDYAQGDGAREYVQRYDPPRHSAQPQPRDSAQHPPRNPAQHLPRHSAQPSPRHSAQHPPRNPARPLPRHSAQPSPRHSAQPSPCHSARQSQNPETTPTPTQPCSSHTLIVVEHRCDVWADLVDRVLVLGAEGLIADGTPHEVFTSRGDELAAMGVWVPPRTTTVNSGPCDSAQGDGTGQCTQRDGTGECAQRDGTGECAQHCDPPPTHGSVGTAPTDPPASGLSARHSPRLSVAHHQSRHSAQPLPCHSAQPLPCHSARQSQNPETTPTPNEPCSSDNPILSTQDLTIGYGTKAVATNLFIDIPQGKSTIITGPNGSGKTTLALTLAGLLPPLSGKVIASDNLAGSSLPHPHTWSSKELLTRIGTVFQSPEHQFVAGTVFDEIAIGLKARGEKRGREPLSRRAHDPKENIEEKVNSLLDEFHLTHLGRANPFTLSGGEKRRLSVATVLAANPQVIILDEPTFGQDYLTWQAMVSMVESLRDQGTTIISVTHDQAYLDTLGDHHINLGER